MKFTLLTAAASLVAAAAAFLSVTVALPIWAMFIGWVSYYTRGHSARDGAINLTGVLVGLLIGMVAATVIGILLPLIGRYAFPLVVFSVAMVVVSFRALPIFNNVLSYFLGLISFFASHLEPGLAAFFELAGASTLGSAAAWVASSAQARIARAV